MAIDSIERTQETPVARGQDAEHALQVAFEAYWSPVCATLYRLVGDCDEAQDLALDVFDRLRQRPPRDWSRLRSWLYRAATNAGLNALRARERRRQYERLAEALRLQRAEPADPATEVERRDACQQVRQVLARMKPRVAQALVLRHSGLSYADIAAALEVAPGSVGTLLARAEREFEQRYRALEVGDETP